MVRVTEEVAAGRKERDGDRARSAAIINQTGRAIKYIRSRGDDSF